MAGDIAFTLKTVRLSAQLRTVAGDKSVQVPVPEQGTVRDLLLALKAAHPVLAERVVNEDGTLKTGMQLVVAGRHIDFLQGLDTSLAGHDDLLLVPPLSGG